MADLVKEAVPTPNHEEFKLWNLTEKGLQEISSKNPIHHSLVCLSADKTDGLLI